MNVPRKNGNELVFIKDCLKETSTGNMASITIGRELTQFLEECQNLGELEAIVISRDESGSISDTFSIIIGNRKASV